MTDDMTVPDGDDYDEMDMDPRDLDRVLDVRIELAVE